MMKKNISRGIGLFLIGVIFSIIIDGFLRGHIQYLYRTLTNDSIYFVGKGLYFLPSYLQCVVFGFWMIIFRKKVLSLDKTKRLRNGLLTIGLFAFTLVLLCFLDGNKKVLQCTMCDDGILEIKRSEINYGVLVSLSLFVSILPIAVNNFIKRRKDGVQNNLEDVLDMETEKL